MKKFTRILSLLMAAIMASAMLVVPASAANTSSGYWKFTGTTAWIHYSSLEPSIKKTKFDYRPNSDTTWVQSYKITGGQLTWSRVEDKHSGSYVNGQKVQMFGKNSKVVSSFTEPAQYYYPNDPISMNVTIKGEASTYAGTRYVFPTTYFQPTFWWGDISAAFDNTGTGTVGGGFTNKADNKGYVYISEPGTVKTTMTATIGDPANYRDEYKSQMHIRINCNDMTLVYSYKWTTGTPSTDDGNDYITITLKKGATTQLGVNTSSKVTYSTSKKSVATVTSTGKVTAKAKGTAIITMKYGSKTQKVMIKVTA